MEKRTKIGKYKTVFKGTIFEIKQARAVLPSGKVKIFEQASRPPSVSVLAVNDKGQLLINHEYRPAQGRYVLRLPSGRVQSGESPRVGAQRELREETGFRAKKLKLFNVAGDGQSLVWKRYAYLATGLIFDPLPGDEDEDITVLAISLPQAMRLIKSGEIKNSMAYLIFKFYNQRSQIKP